jgi:hypothetical protein
LRRKRGFQYGGVCVDEFVEVRFHWFADRCAGGYWLSHRIRSRIRFGNCRS